MKQLDQKSVWLFFLNMLVMWLLIFLFMVLSYVPVFGFKGDLGSILSIRLLRWPVAVFVAIPIVSWAYAKLTFRFYRYELREEGFYKESGIITKKSVVVPYDRIQNVDISRGLLARILGLSDLRIQTAGYSALASRSRFNAEGRLQGLSQVVAEQVRADLIKRASKLKSEMLGL